MLKDRWTTYGFDKVEMPEYSVLLSYPKADKPNKVTLMYDNGTVIYESLGEEKVVLSSICCTVIFCSGNVLRNPFL